MTANSMPSTQHGSPPDEEVQELETGPYLLRPLLSDIALTESGANDGVYITCVELWSDNLYVGTSAGEILHLVGIPPADGESEPQKTFIQASRFSPVTNGTSNGSDKGVGIQQILILPTALKACILSNGTLTFYTLPELTPAFGALKVPECTSVGGVNENATIEQMEDAGGVEVLVCQRGRMRIVRLGESTKGMGVIDVGGCVATVRRDHIACVANDRSYSLLDVIDKQMIPLFDISTVQERVAPSDPSETEGEPRDTSTKPDESNSSTSEPATKIVMEDTETEPASQASDQETPSGVSQFPPRSSSIAATGITSIETADQKQTLDSKPPDRHRKESPEDALLVPHILTPSPEEFLLTTGTSIDEPGVGMFVNMEGDVVPRPTIEFTTYPLAVVLDGKGADSEAVDIRDQSAQEGYVLALVQGGQNNETVLLEIQRWDVESPDPTTQRQHIHLDRYLKSSSVEQSAGALHAGLRSASSPNDVLLEQIVDVLAMSPLPLESLQNLSSGSRSRDLKAIAKRQKEERNFIERLSSTNTRILVWARNCIWSAARNPLILRLESRLQLSTHQQSKAAYAELDRQKLEFVMNDIRGQDATDELEFFALSFVKQKASLLLFLNLVHRTLAGQNVFDRDIEITEEVLLAGEIDPRTVLFAVPSLREEVVFSADGLWLQGGIIKLLSDFINNQDLPTALDINALYSTAILPMVKSFLFSWRRKKGFGSITDEEAVFKSVDAATIKLLLSLDDTRVKGKGAKGSIRAELYDVVDKGVEAFERVLALLESHQRLYVMSRLYQSRKDASNVLATWKRILEGEDDVSGEFVDGENEVRKYLRHLKDVSLVQEYGCWLARRNPALGVRVFGDSQSRVKFKPKEVIDLLKTEAPEAVKTYLEFLVFDKKLQGYADDLIGHYFDSVVHELDASPTAKQIIVESYNVYKALELPKPSYAQFAEQYSVEGEWWRNRVRLLRLLDRNHGLAAQYDIDHVMTRIKPYEAELIPEFVIMYGHQGQHARAIRLLAHGLGDLDTAVSYCVMNGRTDAVESTRDNSTSAGTQQEELFKTLLDEFLKIKDADTCQRQTSELLERFAGWFDIDHVLDITPETWPVGSLLGFLENRFRQLVSERNETAIARALLSVQNLGLSSHLVEKVAGLGPIINGLDIPVQ